MMSNFLAHFKMVNTQTVSLILNVILLLWISVLSFFVFRVYQHFSRLTGKVRGENLIKIIEKVLQEENEQRMDIGEIRKTISSMQLESKGYIQKMGIVRFNPFADTGGEQSFTLGLLDKEDNGVILTGLHTRERTRVYVKPIVKGQSKIDLSKEEDKALKLAIKQ